MTDPAPTRIRWHPFLLVPGVLALLLVWGGTVAGAWSAWMGPADLINAAPATRADLRAIQLQDGIMVSAVVTAVVAGLVIVARRRASALAGYVWLLVAVGVMLWAAAVSRMPGEDLYTVCGNGSEDQIVEAEGWSWTRFSELVVITDPQGARVTTCSRP